MTRKESISMKSGFISVLGILTILLNGLPFSATASDRFPNPSAPDFPIAAWKAFNLNTIPTDQELTLLKEAGFNIASEIIHDTTLMKPVLAKVNSHGLKMVIGSDYIGNRQHMPSVVSRLKGSPALLGYYIADEPTEDQFSFSTPYRQQIREIDPTALAYVNLYPAHDKISNDYTSFLTKFINTVDPQVLSVDIYPIRTSGDYFKTYRRYYETYEILLNTSKKHNIPWMAVCASTGTNEYKTPDETNMRFAAFTALAYGAQAICWYSYQLPPSTTGFFKTAPIVNGTRTNIWYALKKINQEIQRYKEVFLDCNVVRTFLADNITSTSSEYKVNRINTSPISMPLSPGSLDIYWKGAGTGFTTGYVFSQIRNNGHEYLVIVSQDWENSQTLLLKAQGKCVVLNPDGSETTLPVTSSKTIPAGGYLILRLD